MKRPLSKLKRGLEEFQGFLEEKSIGAMGAQRSRLERFAHFWLMVGKSFVRNRCPVRASALAYTTLLAMVPMLAVALSVSTGIFKNQGEEEISIFVDKMVAYIIPATDDATMTTNTEPSAVVVQVDHKQHGLTDTNSLATTPPTDDSNDARKQVSRSIIGFVQNIRAGALGVAGTILLLIAAIFMLVRIEETFNDIWGVQRGRRWMARIGQYCAVILLGPLLLVLAAGLASGHHAAAAKHAMGVGAFGGGLLYRFVPFVISCLAFSLFYMLMPNTKVHWRAAAVGGLVGSLLWHLNNAVSVLYVSRIVTNSKIYGGLAMVPVFMIGLYFSWLFVLFGAQVAYAYQNLGAYVAAKQAENVNQRGREFIALRLMEFLGQRFMYGDRPATVSDLAEQLAVPGRLVQQVMQVLMAARLVVEVTGEEFAYAPGRPLETITCHDILLAMRAGQGQELPTSDGPARDEVQGEFRRILDAEREAASSVTVLAMVNRTEARVALASRQVKAVAETSED